MFFANLSTASRSVYYKLLFQSDDQSAFVTYNFYLNISFYSFLLCIPFYAIRFITKALFESENLANYVLHKNENLETITYLLIGTILNFSYNLFSFKILENVSSVTHSVINIMKRMFVVFGSIIFFSLNLNAIQLFGVVLADSGCLIYSYLKTFKSSINQRTVSTHTTTKKNKKFIKNFITFMIAGILVFIFIYDTSVSIKNKKSNITSINEINIQDKRIICLNKIRKQIFDSFVKIIPIKNEAVLLDIPDHGNYGDTLIW